MARLESLLDAGWSYTRCASRTSGMFQFRQKLSALCLPVLVCALLQLRSCFPSSLSVQLPR